MLNETAAVRYDDDNEPATQSVTTTTAADLRKLEGEQMDAAPKATRKPAKAATAPGKAKTGKAAPQYAVLDAANSEYRMVNPEDLKAEARNIEGDPLKMLVRIVPQVVNINVEITE